ncbi:MAG TPA: AarF/ABC1/UbiB kinase family protein [Methanoregulaceae archaeon]|nr:AarF/ABC1/UbiB kinase family protein [Methanoregulaceae archaeon]
MVTRFRRYGQIADVLVKYGFGVVAESLFPGVRRFRLRAPSAEEKQSVYVRIRLAIEELGPTFVKFGQIMSTRAELLPPPLIEELEKLQDHTNPLPFTQILFVIAESCPEFEEAFEKIEEEPVASASIAQVHRAWLKDGTKVALKIQRPGIEDIIETDIAILKSLAARLEWAMPESRIYNPTGMVADFAGQIEKELDFIKDGRNADRLRKNFEGVAGVRFPKIFWEYSSRHLLVMEFIDGTKVTNLTELRQMGINQKKIAKTGFDAYLKQIFEDGFFHGDPHPGNLFVTPDGDLVFLDFGVVGVLRPEKRFLFVRLLHGIIHMDVGMLLNAFEGLGVVIREEDREAIKDELYTALLDSQGFSLGENDFSVVVNDLTEVLRRYQLRVPTSLMLMLKVIVMILDIGIKLDPQFRFEKEVHPFLEHIIDRMNLPDHMIKEATRSLLEATDGLFDLPRNINQMLKRLSTGTVKVNIVENDIRKLQISLDRLSDKLLIGLVTAAVVVGSSLVLLSSNLKLPDFVWVLAVLGYSAATIVGFYAIYHVIVTSLR